MKSGSYTDKTNPPEFEFTFAPGKFLSPLSTDSDSIPVICNEATANKLVAIEIKNWKPLDGWKKNDDSYDNERDPGKKETVLSGEYTLTIPAAALLKAALPIDDNTAAHTIQLSGPNGDYSLASNGNISGNKKAKDLFAEKFERF